MIAAELVEGENIYGYRHNAKQQFIKIYVTLPRLVTPGEFSILCKFMQISPSSMRARTVHVPGNGYCQPAHVRGEH